jgi:hypothetical protein
MSPGRASVPVPTCPQGLGPLLDFPSRKQQFLSMAAPALRPQHRDHSPFRIRACWYTSIDWAGGPPGERFEPGGRGTIRTVCIPKSLTRTAIWRRAVRISPTTIMIAMTVAMATPAYAQLAPGSSPESAKPSLTVGGDKKAKTEDDLKYERALDRAYKSGLSKIPDQKPKADPWGNVRDAAAPQSNPTQRRPK